MVAANNCQRNLGTALRRHQSEGRTIRTVHVHIARAHVRALVARSREANNRASRQRRHRLDVRIVGVQDDRPAGAGALDKFSLRGSNALETTEATHVGVAHTQLDGHIRGNDVRQVRDMAGTRRAHLQDQVSRRLVSLQDRQGQPDLVVERQFGGHRRPVSAHDLEEQVLRGRLAHGPRHRDDVQRPSGSQRLDVRASKGTQRLSRILDDDLRHGLVNLVLDDDGDRSAPHGTGHEGVPVGALTTARDVQRPRLRLTGIGHHASGDAHVVSHEATRNRLSNPLR